VIGRQIVPNGDGHERGAFFPYNRTVQTLEGVYDEAEDISSNIPRECRIEGHRQYPAKQG